MVNNDHAEQKNLDRSTDNGNAAQADGFAQALVACQNKLYAYILSLLPDCNKADEVLQETNSVLCRKADEFPQIENFGAWATRIAYFEVLAYRKKTQRDRHLFDEELIELLVDSAGETEEDLDAMHRMLRDCLARLSPQNREMILERYSPGGSVSLIAKTLKRPVASIGQTLYRIRKKLLQCIERTQAEEL